ncbi:GTP cyclohydrolase FolE2 [Staphylococcus warneri]|uniref:GTP cyclohydrolase FolE2 n=1 Tax=Staphylococcus warneri TaxID=1292 RepID=UPI00326135A8
MTEFDLSTREGRWKHFGSVDPIEGTKPTTKNEMTDLQSTHKNFLFEIEEVGIKNLTYPVLIDQFQTAGTFSFSTSLNKDEKGINMSRILESVEKHYNNGIELEFNTLYQVLRTLQGKMNQNAAGVDVNGKWFFDRFSPVTQIKAIGSADVTYGLAIEGTNVTRKELTIQAAVTTLCPCSKEISEYSAHNQRGIVTVKAYLNKDDIVIDDYKNKVLDAMEANASSVLYPILKRPDEKRVTERAYENPRFVEDLIRLIAADLVEFDWIEGFDIECRNEESIHQHDAFARLKYRK